MKMCDTVAMLLRSKASNRLLAVSPDQTVFEALQIMAEHEVGALLVLADGELTGILSERDYARKGVLRGHASRETPVSLMMTSPVLSVTPQHTVDECMALMTRHRFRHLPVLEHGHVAGLISIGDLVKWVISGQEKAIHDLEGYISGAYPA